MLWSIVLVLLMESCYLTMTITLISLLMEHVVVNSTGPVDGITMLSYNDHSTDLSVDETCCGQ